MEASIPAGLRSAPPVSADPFPLRESAAPQHELPPGLAGPALDDEPLVPPAASWIISRKLPPRFWGPLQFRREIFRRMPESRELPYGKGSK